MTKKMLASIFLLPILVASVTGRSAQLREEDGFRLRILHVNDIHAHIEETSEDLIRCQGEGCIGGAGRLYTKIKEIRDLDPERTLVLNAGDFYQGTIWYTLFKYKPLLDFANMMNYTAMGLGNHDFDDGVEGLVPFTEGANFAILAANLNASAAPDLEKHCSKSIVKVIDGRKVGIIGYVTTLTPTISNPGKELTFLDEIVSVRKEAQRLKNDGVEILIALGHSGYELDKKMAREIEEIDVVVGGHSHTFLYTGDQLPSTEKPEGDYPTYIQQRSGKVVPVVQAFCYSKYLGDFTVNFDEKGELLQPVMKRGVTNPNVIFLSNDIAQEESVLKAIQEYRPNMTDYINVVGQAEVRLTRGGEEETILGNVLTDAMLIGEWKDENVTIAFINNGGIRSDVGQGNITGEDVLNVLPFNNSIDMLVMSGKNIKILLESFASNLCEDRSCYPGTFLQVSGLKVVYRIQSENAGNRIQSIKTKCQDDANSWCDLEDERRYKLAVISFLARGGTRQSVSFPGLAEEHREGTMSDYDTFVNYLKINNPVNKGLEDRLTYYYGNEGSSGATISANIVLIIGLFSLICSSWFKNEL